MAPHCREGKASPLYLVDSDLLPPHLEPLFLASHLSTPALQASLVCASEPLQMAFPLLDIPFHSLSASKFLLTLFFFSSLLE